MISRNLYQKVHKEKELLNFQKLKHLSCYKILIHDEWPLKQRKNEKKNCLI